MTNQTRRDCALWQAALALVIGPVLPVFAQEVDAQRFRAAAHNAPPKVTRYVHTLLTRHDESGDGQLEPAEWQRMQGSPRAIDHNQDGVILESELLNHVMAYARARMPVNPVPSGEQSRLSGESAMSPIAPSDHQTASGQNPSTNVEGAKSKVGGSQRTTKYVVRPSRATHSLPSWFLGRDADGDRQLTLHEFGSDSAGRSREFDRLDLNGDGILTPQEVVVPRSDKNSPNQRSSPAVP